MNIQDIQSIYEDRITKNYNNLLDIIAEKFAYSILYCSKFTVNHDDDPPYDCSGILKNTRLGLDIEDYKSLGDFLEEYTGDSYPSFVSGCGIRQQQYNEIFSEIVYSFVYETINDMVRDFIDDNNEDFFNLINVYGDIDFNNDNIEILDISDIIYEEFDMIDAYIDFNIMCDLEKLDTKLLYKRGVDKAKYRKNQERIEAEKNRIRIEEERSIADKSYSKIEKLYKIRFNKDLTKVDRTDLENYRKFMKLIKANLSRKEINLIGEYKSSSFSKSVAGTLMNYSK